MLAHKGLLVWAELSISFIKKNDKIQCKCIDE